MRKMSVRILDMEAIENAKKKDAMTKDTMELVHARYSCKSLVNEFNKVIVTGQEYRVKMGIWESDRAGLDCFKEKLKEGGFRVVEEAPNSMWIDKA
jgi:hypothetical protein